MRTRGAISEAFREINNTLMQKAEIGGLNGLEESALLTLILETNLDIRDLLVGISAKMQGQEYKPPREE